MGSLRRRLSSLPLAQLCRSPRLRDENTRLRKLPSSRRSCGWTRLSSHIFHCSASACFKAAAIICASVCLLRDMSSPFFRKTILSFVRKDGIRSDGRTQVVYFALVGHGFLSADSPATAARNRATVNTPKTRKMTARSYRSTGVSKRKDQSVVARMES